MGKFRKVALSNLHLSETLHFRTHPKKNPTTPNIIANNPHCITFMTLKFLFTFTIVSA